MPLAPVCTNPDDLYYQDRLLAAQPFDPVDFARRFEHRRTRVEGVLLHYVVGGRGPLVLFGHGWPASWYEWRKVLPLLAERFTCLAFDLPGLGDSSPPAAFDDASVAALLHGLVVGHLGQEQVFAVGHDISGPPLAYLAARHPGLVRRLFLTETALDGPEMTEVLQAHVNEVWHFPVNAARLTASLGTGREEQFIPQFFTEWVYDVGAFGAADLAEYVRTARRPGVLECGAAYYRKARPGDGVLAEGALSMPVLFVGAELGFGGWLGGDRQRAFRTVARFAPHARYEMAERCSHWVAEERPVYLAARIAEFFAG